MLSYTSFPSITPSVHTTVLPEELVKLFRLGRYLIFLISHPPKLRKMGLMYPVVCAARLPEEVSGVYPLPSFGSALTSIEGCRL